jgi:hypothetical protein
VADEAVLNKVHTKKNQKNFPLLKVTGLTMMPGCRCYRLKMASVNNADDGLTFSGITAFIYNL